MHDGAANVHLNRDPAHAPIGNPLQHIHQWLPRPDLLDFHNTRRKDIDPFDGVATQYTYNDLDQLLTAGVAQYQYDGRGNLARVTDGADVTQYSYDAADRLSGVTLPDGTAVAYTYDAAGRRVRQSVAAQVTNYLWDEISSYGDVVLETDGGGSTLASYVLGGTELLEQTRSGATSYYLRDGQGSTRALSDDSGAVTDTYAYTAFGELYVQTGTIINAYLYTGQQFDSLTGLYSLRARYYDSGNGRFLSRDAANLVLMAPVEIDRYVYTANNPINAVDPGGLQAFVEYSEANQTSEEESVVIKPVGENVELQLERLVDETGSLRTTMLRNGDALGRSYNPGDVAHHIVEQGRPGAQAARDILQKWGIDIQSHYDGLWLDSATHYTTFASKYTQYVNEQLSFADPLGREAVLQALKDIATDILMGLIP